MVLVSLLTRDHSYMNVEMPSFHFRWLLLYANMADMLIYDISLAMSVISEMKVYATCRKFTR